MRQRLRNLTASPANLFRAQTSTLLQPQSLSSFSSKSNHSRLTQNQQEDAEEEKLDGRAKFQLHKSRGQHILTNPRVLDSIVKRAQVLPTDTVLEIGPGTGNLTVRLLESARRVVAVEIDGRMVDALQMRAERLGLQDRLTVSMPTTCLC